MKKLIALSTVAIICIITNKSVALASTLSLNSAGPLCEQGVTIQPDFKVEDGNSVSIYLYQGDQLIREISNPIVWDRKYDNFFNQKCLNCSTDNVFWSGHVPIKLTDPVGDNYQIRIKNINDGKYTKGTTFSIVSPQKAGAYTDIDPSSWSASIFGISYKLKASSGDCYKSPYKVTDSVVRIPMDPGSTWYYNTSGSYKLIDNGVYSLSGLPKERQLSYDLYDAAGNKIANLGNNVSSTVGDFTKLGAISPVDQTILNNYSTRYFSLVTLKQGYYQPYTPLPIITQKINIDNVFYVGVSDPNDSLFQKVFFKFKLYTRTLSSLGSFPDIIPIGDSAGIKANSISDVVGQQNTSPDQSSNQQSQTKSAPFISLISLTSDSEDYAGVKGVFSQGYVQDSSGNLNHADWGFTLNLTMNGNTKTISSIDVTLNSKNDTWSTSNSNAWPLVVLKGDQQLNFGYGKNFVVGPATEEFRLYAQQYNKWQGGTISIKFADGTVLTAPIPADLVSRPAVPPSGKIPASSKFANILSGVTDKLNSVATDGTSVVIVGDNSTILKGATKADGIVIAKDSLPIKSVMNFSAVAYGGGKYVVGQDDVKADCPTCVGTPPALFSSTDGVSWKSEVSPFPYAINIKGLAYNGGNFVVIPENVSIRWADTSLAKWNKSTINNQMVLLENYLSIAPIGSNGFVVSCDGDLIRKSKDLGNSWDIVEGKNDLDSYKQFQLHGIAADLTGNIIVSVGAKGKILTSLDGGKTWVDSRKILTSIDGGQTWWSQANTVIFNNLNAVAYAGKQFVAVGDGGLILASNDGVSWVKLDSSTTNNLYGVTGLSDGTIVVVGDKGTVLTTGSVSNSVNPPVQSESSDKGPNIKSVSPIAARAGDIVIITGNGFSPTENVINLSEISRPRSISWLASSTDGKTLKFIVPNYTYQTYNLSVENNILEDSNIVQFTILAPATAQSVIPASLLGLRRGAKSASVKTLQSSLINMGYLETGNDTGYYGPLTEKAVMNYISNQVTSVKPTPAPTYSPTPTPYVAPTPSYVQAPTPYYTPNYTNTPTPTPVNTNCSTNYYWNGYTCVYYSPSTPTPTPYSAPTPIPTVASTPTPAPTPSSTGSPSPSPHASVDDQSRLTASLGNILGAFLSAWLGK